MGEDLNEGYFDTTEDTTARQEWAALKMADLQVVGKALEQGLLTDKLVTVGRSQRPVIFLARLSLRSPSSWRIEPTYNREQELTSTFTITNSPPSGNMDELYHYGAGAQLVRSWSDGKFGAQSATRLEEIDDLSDVNYVDRAANLALRFVDRHLDSKTVHMLSAPTTS